MLDPGKYRARAIEGAIGETSTEKEQVTVLFELLDVPGKTITWYGYWTEATWERTIEALRTMGWTGSDIDDLSELSDPSMPEVYLVIDQEPNEKGVLREKVKWVNKSAGGLAMKTALEPTKARAFAERVKAQIALFDQQHGHAAPQGPASAQQQKAKVPF